LSLDSLLSQIAISINDSAINVDDLTRDIKSSSSEDFSESIKFYETVRNGGIPKSFPQQLTRNLESNWGNSTIAHLIGSALQKCGYYGKATKDFAEDLKYFIGDKILLDPMAGNGFMVKAFREAGIRTIGTDDNSWRISENFENLDAIDSLRKYGDEIDYLLISWAPANSDVDVRLLREVRSNFPHITIINIGEFIDGCTGSDDFWEEAEEHYLDLKYETLMQVTDFVTFVS
jgi:hypothetical protein